MRDNGFIVTALNRFRRDQWRSLLAMVTVMMMIAVGAAGFVVVTPPVPAEAQEECGIVTVDFTEVGEHSFTVPAGVEEITVEAFGARGGTVAAGNNPGIGGFGGRATTPPIDVTPGEVLQVIVAGLGGDVPTAVGSPATPGGFNGGGNGGLMVAFDTAAHGGAGGGGASEVLRAGVALAIAGGGGGGAHGGSGGDGGENGTNGVKAATATGPAQPGLSGGNGGTGGVGDPNPDGVNPDGDDGAAGQGGTGGAGGDGGGGGGGGVLGGGGGGGGAATVQGGGAGGGGGSSFGPPGTIFETGVRNGNGSVDISYSDPECIDLDITKTATIVEGRTVEFGLTVVNLGPGDATGVVVNDELPDGMDYVSDTCGGDDLPPWTWAIGDLAEGGSVDCTITMEAQSAGTFANTAAVIGDQDETDIDNNEDTATIVIPELVDLGIVKSASVDVADVGDSFGYTLVVTNHGPDDATGVTVTDELPDAVTYVSDTCDGDNVPPWTWDIGNLDVDDSVECTITVEVTTAGTIENTAVVEGDQEDPNPDNDEDTATVVPPDDEPEEIIDLQVTKTASVVVADDGDTFDYTLVVTNDGPDDATGVTVTDDLPDAVAYVSDTCDGDDVPPWTWDIGALAVDGSVECIITVEVLAAGSIENTAVVTGDQHDPNPDNDADTATVVSSDEELVDLGIVKTASVVVADDGDTFDYTLVVTNDGPDDATGVTVTDDLPDAVAYVSDTCDGDDVPPWTWDIGALAVDGSVECIITVEVLAAGSIENTAVVTGDQHDPNPDNDVDTARISAPDEETPGGGTTDPPKKGGTLPFTGLQISLLAAMGLASLVSGAGLLEAGRRRRRRMT